MNELVLAYVPSLHEVLWGVVVNDCWYHQWQQEQAIEKGMPVWKFNCGFIYFTPIVSLRVKKSINANS